MLYKECKLGELASIQFDAHSVVDPVRDVATAHVTPRIRSPSHKERSGTCARTLTLLGLTAEWTGTSLCGLTRHHPSVIATEGRAPR